jgi:hypothetical protein
MKRRNFLTGALVAAALGLGSMGAVPAFASPENPVIGFSIDDLRVGTRPRLFHRSSRKAGCQGKCSVG